MKKFNIFDTIAAISTPPGEGGIGIVRLSGENSFEIIKKIFRPRNSQEFNNPIKSFTMHLGYITDRGKIIDEVLVSFMKAPHTYTREDVVEINCHGGAIAVNEVLRLVLEKGARLAEPGEFTKRAYINGRIDLSQAEAILDIIRAKTKESLNLAVQQLKGTLSQEINSIVNDLKNIMVHIEANIDFPEEEDIIQLDYNQIKAELLQIKKRLLKLIDSYDSGRIYKNGVLTVLAGRPNVGKSSLLNSFLKYDRAIVTPIPGTTRDIIEEQINIGGIPFILADTAGITESKDTIEKEGVKRAELYLDRAELILLVFDNSSKLTEKDIEIVNKLKNKQFIPIINKVDLPPKLDIKDFEDKTKINREKVSFISAKDGKGLKDLEHKMEEIVKAGKSSGDYSIMITNSRHYSLLKRALKELKQGIKATVERLEPELLAFDLRNTMDYLGQIVGEITPKEILDNIFKNFCIGK